MTTGKESLCADLETRQAHILATVRELREIGVPEPVLAPIIRWACVDMWSEAAE